MDWKFNLKSVAERLGKRQIYSCLIVVAVFAVIITFVGPQSLVHRVQMAIEYRQKKKVLREYRESTEQINSQLRALENPDSLERFAREEYHMHAEGEDVFLIDE